MTLPQIEVTPQNDANASPARPKRSGLFRSKPSWADSRPSPANGGTSKSDAVDEPMFSKSTSTFALLKEEKLRREALEEARRQQEEAQEARLKERQIKRRRLSDETDGKEAEGQNVSESPEITSPKPPTESTSSSKPSTLSPSKPYSSLVSFKPKAPPWAELNFKVTKEEAIDRKNPSAVVLDSASDEHPDHGKLSRSSHSKQDASTPVNIDGTADQSISTPKTNGDGDSRHSPGKTKNEKAVEYNSTLNTKQAASPIPKAKGSPNVSTAQVSPSRKPPASPSKPERPNPIVEILVFSKLPNTHPLICKRRIHQNLREVRLAWIGRQFDAISEETKDKIFLINHLKMRLFDVTTPASLGFSVDPISGQVYMKGREGESLNGGNGEEDDNKIWMQAVTEESLKEQEQQEKEEREAAIRQKEANQTHGVQARHVKKAGPNDPDGLRIHVILKAKGYEEYKVRVRPTTKILQMVKTFRKVRKVPDEKQVFLMFDGEQLEEGAEVQQTDIADMDHIDVYVK